MENGRLVKLQPYIDGLLDDLKEDSKGFFVVQEDRLINTFRKAYTQGFQDALIEIALGVQESLDKE